MGLHCILDGIDQVCGSGVRYPFLNMVHDIAERKAGGRIGEAERPPEAGEPEGRRAVPECVGCGQAETGADPDGYAQDAIDAPGLFGGRRGHDVGCENAMSIDLADERGVEAGQCAGGADAVGRGISADCSSGSLWSSGGVTTVNDRTVSDVGSA